MNRLILAMLIILLLSSCREDRHEKPYTFGTSKTAVSEKHKIEQLIASVEDLDGATFIRNGTRFSAADAAAHLRRKLNAAAGRVKTAEHFIEHLASKSSVSGIEYTITMPGGHVIPAEQFFRAQLADLEGVTLSSEPD